MSFLAAFFAISDVPSVNAYASLGFVNFIPVIAFYYFFTNWVPARYKKAGLIAAVLFMLGSGYGWLYALNLELSYPSPNQISSIDNLLRSGQKTIDIWAPNTFIGVGHPDITTALIIIALPAGFFLLGLVKENNFSNKRYFILVLAITTLGILGHDEFGFFIVMLIISPWLFTLRNKNSFYLAIIGAVAIVIAITYIIPGQERFYRIRGISGVPFIFFYLIFSIGLSAAYYFNTFSLLKSYVSRSISYLKREIPNNVSITIKLGISISLICIVAYLYGLSFVIWDANTPNFELYADTNGLNDIPDYFLPLRFGISGLLGIALLLSYLLKRFETEIFIFGIFGILAYLILSDPQYSDFRGQRYIMASLDALAAIFIYRIIMVCLERIKKGILVNSLLIGTIVTFSSFSALMYIGITAMAVQESR